MRVRFVLLAVVLGLGLLATWSTYRYFTPIRAQFGGSSSITFPLPVLQALCKMPLLNAYGNRGPTKGPGYMSSGMCWPLSSGGTGDACELDYSAVDLPDCITKYSIPNGGQCATQTHCCLNGTYYGTKDYPYQGNPGNGAPAFQSQCADPRASCVPVKSNAEFGNSRTTYTCCIAYDPNHPGVCLTSSSVSSSSASSIISGGCNPSVCAGHTERLHCTNGQYIAADQFCPLLPGCGGIGEFPACTGTSDFYASLPCGCPSNGQASDASVSVTSHSSSSSSYSSTHSSSSASSHNPCDSSSAISASASSNGSVACAAGAGAPVRIRVTYTRADFTDTNGTKTNVSANTYYTSRYNPSQQMSAANGQWLPVSQIPPDNLGDGTVNGPLVTVPSNMNWAPKGVTKALYFAFNPLLQPHQPVSYDGSYYTYEGTMELQGDGVHIVDAYCNRDKYIYNCPELEHNGTSSAPDDDEVYVQDGVVHFSIHVKNNFIDQGRFDIFWLYYAQDICATSNASSSSDISAINPCASSSQSDTSQGSNGSNSSASTSFVYCCIPGYTNCLGIQTQDVSSAQGQCMNTRWPGGTGPGKVEPDFNSCQACVTGSVSSSSNHSGISSRRSASSSSYAVCHPELCAGRESDYDCVDGLFNQNVSCPTGCIELGMFPQCSADTGNFHTNLQCGCPATSASSSSSISVSSASECGGTCDCCIANPNLPQCVLCRFASSSSSSRSLSSSNASHNSSTSYYSFGSNGSDSFYSASSIQFGSSAHSGELAFLGDICTVDAQCITNLCRNNLCVACITSSDCTSGMCRGGICLNDHLPNGSSCSADVQCLSNLCRNNVCVACSNDAQCASGICRSGICAATGTLPATVTRSPITEQSPLPSAPSTLPSSVVELPFMNAVPNSPTDLNQANVVALQSSAPSTPSTGPEALVVMLAGGAAGWLYRKRR